MNFHSMNWLRNKNVSFTGGSRIWSWGWGGRGRGNLRTPPPHTHTLKKRSSAFQPLIYSYLKGLQMLSGAFCITFHLFKMGAAYCSEGTTFQGGFRGGGAPCTPSPGSASVFMWMQFWIRYFCKKNEQDYLEQNLTTMHNMQPSQLDDNKQTLLMQSWSSCWEVFILLNRFYIS